MNTSEFLTDFFTGKPNDAYILIWTKKDISKDKIEKSSIWFQNPTEAASAASQILDREVYFGVGASPNDFGPNKRCEMPKIAAIFGVWIDIDIAGGGHKKKNLPSTVAEAEALLNECKLRPTYIVHSGGGLQAYWQLVKPVVFTGSIGGEESRQIMYQLAQSWNAYFKKLAAGHKWDMDSVFDLARVMRLPGTYNCKIPGAKRPVKVVDAYGGKYTPDQLAAYLVAALDPIPAASTPPPVKEINQKIQQTEDYILDPKAVYNPELFDSMTELDAKFAATWQHKRKDFQDQSLSTYDMSLIGITLRAGWPVQEIVNLITHHRRKYGDEKTDERTGLLRRDYYDRSIQNARDFMESGAAGNIPADQLDAAASGPEARPKTLAAISLRLGANITNVSRVMEDSPYFRLDLADGVSINLGDAAGILNPVNFRNKVATAAKIAIPRYKPAMWDNIASKLLGCANDETPDPLETSSGFVAYYVRDYLQSKTPVAHSDPEAVAGHPFHWHEQIYITLARFLEWLTLRKVGIKGYSGALKKVGCTQETRHVGVRGEDGATRSCWFVPSSIYYMVFIHPKE